MEVVFLYRVKDDLFEHVENEDLFEKLFMCVSGLCAADIVSKAIEEHKEELLNTPNE